MITSININNFKAIREATLIPKRLNLFTGINSSGKSSILQSLLLLRQSHRRGNMEENGLLIDGDHSILNLGTVQDVFNHNAEKTDQISIEIRSDKSRLRFCSQPWEDSDRSARSLSGSTIREGSMSELKLLNGDFQYLSADRIAPSESYPRSEFPMDASRTKMDIGKDGRFVAHYLELFGNKDLSLELLNPATSETNKFTLNQMVTAWLQEISPNVTLRTQENLSTNRIVLSFQYQLETAGGAMVPTGDRKPQNVGFGLTHTLPILVAILGADPGDVLIIENPETHLHPRGQSRMGMLMAMAANEGVQLFVETHSDHILNGIRVATKQSKIDPDNVSISFFSQSALTGDTQIDQLPLLKNGKITRWPDGFFDEWSNMLDALI